MNNSLFFVAWLFLAAMGYTAAENCNDSSYQTKVVCFISASNPHFSYDRLGSSLCTHYILIDLVIVNCQSSLSLVEQSIPALSLFLEFKDRLRDTDDVAKFILAIGGSNQESNDFSQSIAAEDGLVELAKDIVDFVKRHDLDGVDISWFNPGEVSEIKADRINLVRLLRELRLQMDAGASLSLTAATQPELFDVRSIDVYVDFVNLLTVDYHDLRKPSHVAPLYSKDPENPSSIFHSVQAFVKAGLNKQKVVVLTSTHGYLYTYKFCFSEGQMTVKSIEKLNKYRVQKVLEEDDFNVSWDDMRQVPYGTLSLRTAEKKWITFSDLESHQLKAKFVLKYQLGGIGAYTIDQEGDEARMITEGCQPGIPFPFLWILVDAVRPRMTYKHPPLVISEDYAVQYVPKQKSVQVVNVDKCDSEGSQDVPYRKVA